MKLNIVFPSLITRILIHIGAEFSGFYTFLIFPHFPPYLPWGFHETEDFYFAAKRNFAVFDFQFANFGHFGSVVLFVKWAK